MVMAIKSLFLIVFAFFPFVAFGEAGDDTNRSIITAEDIAREKPADIGELLRSRVGLDDSGGTITMRGVVGVVIVIDGISSTLSGMKQVKPEQVERVEIIRGAASARFGADGMGGAIVVTRKKAGRESSLSLIQGYTSSDSRYSRVIASGGAGAFSLNLMGEYSLVDGYKRVTQSPYPYQITVDEERSEKETVDAKLGYQRGDVEGSLRLKGIHSNISYGRPNWWERFDTFSANLLSTVRPSSDLDLELTIGYERTRDKGLRDRGTGIDAAGLAPDRFIFSDNDRYDAELVALIKNWGTPLRIGAHYGLSIDSYRISDFSTGEEQFSLDATMANGALFLLTDIPLLQDITLGVSARYDLYWYLRTDIFNPFSAMTEIKGPTVTKGSFNPKLGLFWKISEATSLNASAGTGFIPPSPDQLYYSDIGPATEFLANPELKPQRSLTADMGIKTSPFSGLDLALTFFYTLWQDKIGVQIVDYGTPLKQQFRNIGEAESKGIELQLDQRISDRWSTSFNYTYTQTEITENRADPALVGNELPDMPQHKFNLGLVYEKKNDLTARLLLRYVGPSFTDERNTVVDSRGFRWKREGYAVLNGSVVKRFSKPMKHVDGLDLTVAVDNIFDNRYRTGFFWRDEGRLIRAEAALRF